MKLIAHEGGCTALVFSPTGESIATGGADKKIVLWSSKTMEIKSTLTLKSPICSLAYSLDNNFLMACTSDHKATLYNLKLLKPMTSFQPHNDLITSTKFCFSQKMVLTSSLDQTIKCWDVSNLSSIKVINCYSSCFDMHVSRSETYIVSGHKDTSIRLWNLKTKDSVWKISDAHGDPVCCTRITPNENYIISTSKDNTIKIWDVRKQSLL